MKQYRISNTTNSNFQIKFLFIPIEIEVVFLFFKEKNDISNQKISENNTYRIFVK